MINNFITWHFRMILRNHRMKNKHRETFIRKLLHCGLDIWYKVDNKFDRTSLGLKKRCKKRNCNQVCSRKVFTRNSWHQCVTATNIWEIQNKKSMIKNLGYLEGERWEPYWPQRVLQQSSCKLRMWNIQILQNLQNMLSLDWNMW